MNQKPTQQSVDDFELQPSEEEAHKAPAASPVTRPVPPPVAHRPASPAIPMPAAATVDLDDPNAFDPDWVKQAAKPNQGHGRATPARGNELPHIAPVDGPALDLPDLQPAEGAPEDGPTGPPPSEKVDFENLPAFVAQRKMLKNVAIGASIAGVLIVILVIWLVFKAGKSTYVPITDELKKDTPDIGDQFKDKK